jgi:hypothetical protein
MKRGVVADERHRRLAAGLGRQAAPPPSSRSPRARPVSSAAALLFTTEKLQPVLALLSSGFGLGSRARSIELSASSTKASSGTKGMEICTLR